MTAPNGKEHLSSSQMTALNGKEHLSSIEQEAMLV
jgi:hypothetical protein